MWRTLLLLGLLWMGIGSELPQAWAVRVKDIATLRGARNNQLTGFGIVVGLDGTGDTPTSLLSRKPIVNALERMGISLEHKDITGRSIAAVWLISTLPPFAKSGQRLDVTVSTIGDATSLRGGILVMAPLRGPNRLVYAVSQGPIVGIPQGIGKEDGAAAPETPSKTMGESMVASVGHIPGGALVEREINLNLNSRARLFMNLSNPDFTTSFRLAKLINQNLGFHTSRAKDAGTVEISVPDSYLGNTVELISYIENLEITPDSAAQVVLDERTGTIVMGGNVRISPVAISHGNMSIHVRLPSGPSQVKPVATTAAVAAPGAPGAAAPAAEGADENEIDANVFLLKGGADLKEVVDGFNKIGGASKDLVQVLKAIKAAGALHAELIIQ